MNFPGGTNPSDNLTKKTLFVTYVSCITQLCPMKRPCPAVGAITVATLFLHLLQKSAGR